MKHLTAADRGKIEVLLQENYTNKDIANKIGRSKSTIGREIVKGLDGIGVYHAWIAQVAYEANRKKCIQLSIIDNPVNFELRGKIVQGLQQGWDPSMISGRLAKEGFRITVCAESIYKWIYSSTWAKAEKTLPVPHSRQKA